MAGTRVLLCPPAVGIIKFELLIHTRFINNKSQRMNLSYSHQPARLLVTVFLTVLLNSCSLSNDPVLRIGSNQWIGYEPVFLSRSLGHLNEEHVHLVEMRSSTQVATQIRKGNLEGGLITLDETLSLIDAGIDMRVVTILDISSGADAMLARPGIELNQLKGKKVGVENTAVGAILLGSALQGAGLEPSDIFIVPVEADNQYDNFMSGGLDAIVTFEPTRTQLLKQGAVQIYDSSRDNGLIMDVIAVRADKIAAYHENIARLVEAYFKARDFMQRHPLRALLQMAPRLGISPAELKSSYSGVSLPDLNENEQWMKQEKFATKANQLIKLMKKSSLLSPEFSPPQLLDAQFVEQLN